MIRFVHRENNYVNYKIMKTIKELEKEITQARIKAILKQYQNGEFAREAEIMHARMIKKFLCGKSYIGFSAFSAEKTSITAVFPKYCMKS